MSHRVWKTCGLPDYLFSLASRTIVLGVRFEGIDDPQLTPKCDELFDGRVPTVASCCRVFGSAQRASFRQRRGNCGTRNKAAKAGGGSEFGQRSAAIGDPKKRLELVALKAAVEQVRGEYAFCGTGRGG
jgi:hypothetical protein